MVFFAGSRIIVTTTSMYYYLWDKLSEFSKLKTKEERISEVTTLFQVTAANYEEQTFTFNDEGTVLYVNGDTACISVISKDAIQKDEELRPIFEHCQDLIKAKHTKWLEETFEKEVSEAGVPMYSLKKKEEETREVKFSNEEPLNYHQLAMVTMFGIIFNIDKEVNINAGKCIDIDIKYKYNLESFQCFLDFLEPFVCEANPITESSFDILTYNYCNLYDQLEDKTHILVENLVLSLIKSNYKN